MPLFVTVLWLIISVDAVSVGPVSRQIPELGVPGPVIRQLLMRQPEPDGGTAMPTCVKPLTSIVSATSPVRVRKTMLTVRLPSIVKLVIELFSAPIITRGPVNVGSRVRTVLPIPAPRIVIPVLRMVQVLPIV